MLDAHKLIEIRKSLGLNQEDFGRKIGYSREVVSKVENGKMELKKEDQQVFKTYQPEPTSFKVYGG